MRITGGSYRGRKIKCPPGIIRPAMDRMRESLFSILRDLEGYSFLDLFSGSGVVGIEAASRGADPITLVEMDFKKKVVIQENLSFVEQKVSLTLKPVERFLKSCTDTFDLIYADPPFNYKNKINILSLISEKKILKEEGRLIIHLPSEDLLPEQVENLIRYDRRDYGRSILLFYHWLNQ